MKIIFNLYYLITIFTNSESEIKKDDDRSK